MARKIRFYETFDYKTRCNYWWTQRNNSGVCFEIRRDTVARNKFNLYKCDEFFASYATLQDAINEATTQW